MPIKGKREVTCEKCGKKFIVVCNDALTLDDLKKLNNKLCIKCRIMRMIRGR
jgi:hypothetical protein